MPKTDAEAALTIIQERFQRAESGRRLRHKGGQWWEECWQGRGEGQDEEEKEELSYLYQKRIMLLFKGFVRIHPPPPSTTSLCIRKTSAVPLTEQHPQGGAVTMTANVDKSWSLLRNLCVISLKWAKEELKCTEYLLQARLVQEASFIISFNLQNNSETYSYDHFMTQETEAQGCYITR